MSLSSISIKRPVTVTMFFIGIALIGIYSFSLIGVDLLPNVNMPHLMVQTNYSNAAPEEVEKLVSEPLESAIGTVNGVKKITSVSKEGISVISIDFVWGTDMDMAVLSMREKLDNMRFRLPREVERPTIIRADPNSTPVMTLVLGLKKFRNKRNIRTVETKADAEESEIESKSGGYQISFVDHNSPEWKINRLISLKEAARVVYKRRLEQLDGVAQAVVTGGLEREILIEADPARLDLYNLTFTDISRALSRSNINYSAGMIMKGLFRYSLRTMGEYDNIDQIEKTIVKHNKDGSVIYIDDLAEVRENFKDREGLTRLNGAETVGMLIYKEPESNTVSIAKKIRKTVKNLREEYPEFDLITVSDHSNFISAAITNVRQEVLYGGVLAIIVLFFFLGSLRNIFAIGITIPSSLVLTVLLMHLFNINFNIISLGGIALGVGMLLDNSIVVIENIVRYKEKGLNLRQAAMQGASEVSMPVVTATLTTMVVFLPLIFIEGIAGELFKDQSYAIAFSLTASIITAITLIPMLASREKYLQISDPEKYSQNYIKVDYPRDKGIFKKIKFWLKFPFVVFFKSLVYFSVRTALSGNKLFKKIFGRFFRVVDKWMEKWIAHYERLLLWSLENKKKVLLITLALVLITAAAVINMKKEFIPESPQEEFVVELSFPKGTSLRGNAAITGKIESAIMSVPKVKNVVANIGRVNEFDYLNKEQVSVNKTNMIVKIDSYENYYTVQDKLREIFKGLKGIDYSFKQVKTAYTQVISPSENDIEIKIKNKNLEAAYKKGKELVAKLNEGKIKGLEEIWLGTEKGVPGYNIKISREKCLAYGVDVNRVADKIVNMVKGNNATSFSDFDKKVFINVKSSEENRDNIEEVLNEYVILENRKIPLSGLVEFELTESYSEIWREDQSRAIFVYASIGDANLDNVIENIENQVNSMSPLPGEIISVGGANEEITSSFSALYAALLISVLLMYMILASEFESFLFPFIIIFSVPLGLIGGILLLYLFGESISIISLMGLIILVGIADNDAVVKVEFILRKRKEGLNVRDAIVQAGHDRFRPIVMNSFTVIFGLIPMMIGLGAGTQLRISLSLAIAGGLISATFLTLIIIPVLYTYLERWSRKDFNELVE